MKSDIFKKLLALTAAMTTVVTLSACGQQSLNGQFGSGTNSSNALNKVPDDLWAKIDTQGSGSNAVMGSQSFSIDKNTGLLKLHFDLPLNIFGGSISYPIPEIPGASVSVEPDTATGKWELSFNIPLSAIVHGVGLVGPTTLPNGNPLPGVPGGEPPRIGAHITRGNLDFYIYGSIKYFALFYPTPTLDKYFTNPWLNIALSLAFANPIPLYNKDKTKILGYFTPVMPANGASSGMFISIVFPPELSALLDQIF